MMREVDYRSWAKYIVSLMTFAGKELRRSKVAGERLCELACGTGNISFMMSRLGYDVTGIDSSDEMLKIASSKLAKGKGAKPHFINHDMITYSSRNVYDRAVCVYDSINYLSNVDAVEKFFENVYLSLKVGGVFVFDASMESNSLNDASLFVQRGRHKGIYYQRRSQYDPKRKVHTTYIRVKDKDDIFEEVHEEHVYGLETLRRLFKGAGFEEKFAAGDFTMLEADDRSERIHFVLVKAAND